MLASKANIRACQWAELKQPVDDVHRSQVNEMCNVKAQTGAFHGLIDVMMENLCHGSSVKNNQRRASSPFTRGFSLKNTATPAGCEKPGGVKSRFHRSPPGKARGVRRRRGRAEGDFRRRIPKVIFKRERSFLAPASTDPWQRFHFLAKSGASSSGSSSRPSTARLRASRCSFQDLAALG